MICCGELEMKYYSQKKYTIIINTSQVIAALILAAPLMWEGIDDVNTSFSIQYGSLWTTITREIFKILIYFLLQNIIILDGLSFSNVYPKINFDLTWPLRIPPWNLFRKRTLITNGVPMISKNYRDNSKHHTSCLYSS